MQSLTVAERLKATREAAKLTQSGLAQKAKVSQGTIGNIESGARGYGESVVRIATALGVTPEYLISGVGVVPRPAPTEDGQPLSAGRPILALHEEDAIPDGVVLIKESRVRFSGGNGHKTPHYEEIEDSLPASYRRSWFTHEGMNPAKVRRFPVKGRSMEPILFDGDTILVNQAETEVKDGQVYAIRYGDEMRVKRLYRRLDGGLVLQSDNPDYAPEEVSPAMVNEHIDVIGRVREKSGKGGL